MYILGEEGVLGREDTPKQAARRKIWELACSHAILFPFLAFRGCAHTWVLGWIENNKLIFFVARDNIFSHLFKKKNFFLVPKSPKRFSTDQLDPLTLSSLGNSAKLLICRQQKIAYPQ